jgi:hypothetical protein
MGFGKNIDISPAISDLLPYFSNIIIAKQICNSVPEVFCQVISNILNN